MTYEQALEILKQKTNLAGFTPGEIVALDMAIQGLEVLVNRRDGKDGRVVRPCLVTY